ncbi:rRNA maturation RNase YbeY, partial [Planctomycetota bacterium]|nr:rRNA maturation RNase YbeY [Planctomycetota bacterium]
MITVDIHSTVRTRIDRKLIEAAVKAALKGRIKHAEVSVAVVGDARMRRINRESLDHDYTTDVLSFDHGETPEGQMIELIVCAPMAKRQAAKRKISFKEELARYAIHGALHTAGFDD